MLKVYLDFLNEGHYEVKFAFEGMADEHVWKRPAEGLLSAGEIAGHIAFWEAMRLAGEGGDPLPDPEKCHVKSPLIDQRFSYYPDTLSSTPSMEQLAMTADQVCQELTRVHEAAVAYIKDLNPNLDGGMPGWAPHWTYRSSLKYAAFHIAYHTGQIYSVRHLLGEQTPDN